MSLFSYDMFIFICDGIEKHFVPGDILPNIFLRQVTRNCPRSASFLVWRHICRL